MCQQVADSGGSIDMVFAAIELKNDPASRRKPNTNMALEAQRQFPEIDFSKSIMVGDTGTDLLFGQALGMKTVLIESQELVTVPSDFRCSDLSTFLHKI
jgi:HAD superfamily hydrolase (TIGR01662 family)